MVMILLNEKVDKVQFDEKWMKDNPGKCDNAMLPSWLVSQKVGKASGFLQRIAVTFPKDGVTDEQCELVEAYFIKQKDLMDEKASKGASEAVVGLYKWATAIVGYHYIMNNFEPIIKAVDRLNKELEKANSSKDKALSELKEKQDVLDKLEAAFAIDDNKRKDYQADSEKTKEKLNKAQSLIQGLEGEHKRWSQQLKEIDQSIIKLVGDVVLASAFLSYCGPFNQ